MHHVDKMKIGRYDLYVYKQLKYQRNLIFYSGDTATNIQISKVLACFWFSCQLLSGLALTCRVDICSVGFHDKLFPIVELDE